MGQKIDYSKAKNAAEAYEKGKSVITPDYIKKFQVKADVTCDDSSKKIKAAGSGFTLTLSFHDTYCEADLDLSLILRALKSKILTTVEDQVKKNI